MSSSDDGGCGTCNTKCAGVGCATAWHALQKQAPQQALSCVNQPPAQRRCWQQQASGGSARFAVRKYHARESALGGSTRRHGGAAFTAAPAAQMPCRSTHSPSATNPTPCSSLQLQNQPGARLQLTGRAAAWRAAPPLPRGPETGGRSCPTAACCGQSSRPTGRGVRAGRPAAPTLP